MDEVNRYVWQDAVPCHKPGRLWVRLLSEPTSVGRRPCGANGVRGPQGLHGDAPCTVWATLVGARLWSYLRRDEVSSFHPAACFSARLPLVELRQGPVSENSGDRGAAASKMSTTPDEGVKQERKWGAK